MQSVAQTAFRYLPIVLMALAWEVIARLNLVDTLALPPLSNVAVAWLDLMRDGELVDNGASSLYRAFAGLLLAVVVGGGLGLLMARWRLLDMFVNPLVELFYPLPKSALIPVTVLWLGFGDGSKILLIFLGCMIPVTIGAYNGARGSDHALIWSARSMGAGRVRMMLDVVMPSALPELLNGVRTALGARLHSLGQLRTDRIAEGVRLSDRLSRLDRLLRRHVCGGAHGRLPRLCGGPDLSAPHAMVAAMARLEDTASLAAAEAEVSRDAARRLGVVFQSGAGIFSILVVLLAWELFARSGKVTPFMLPAFSVVLARIYTDAVGGDLWINLGLTIYRAMAGFAIATIGGITLGALMSRSKIARWFFDPIISVGFPMPKIAFLPIIMLWFGLYDFSKISIVVFDAIFPVVTATLGGIASVDKELIWSGRNMGANEREMMWQILLPAALPQILTGLQVALPISLIVAIIAEMAMGGYGLGGAMMTASRYANSPGVFAGIVEIAVIGYALIKAMAAIRRRLLAWHPETAERG